MRLLFQACSLAVRDWLHEGLLSACAVLGLAAVLAPLLVLYGVKFGVVGTMTERMRSDPRNLEISPVSGGFFAPAFFEELRKQPDTVFVLPRTRSIAAVMRLAAGTGLERRVLNLPMEPAAPGDPLLSRWLKTPPGDGVVLSASAARKLDVREGDALTGLVERTGSGLIEAASIELRVAAVLPLDAQSRDLAFVPLPLLEATEDFRDGKAPPGRLTPPDVWEGKREYAGFRLYARNLDGVARLRAFLNAKGIEVYTKVEEIEQIKNLDHSLTLIFSLIGAAAAAGFFASTASSTLAGVKRKERSLGLVRLLGFPTAGLMLFPLIQALLTAVLGTALACGLYAGAATVIDALFRHSLGDAEYVCRLLPEHFALTFGLVIALSVPASLPPAARAARIEPSEVIRDV